MALVSDSAYGKETIVGVKFEVFSLGFLLQFWFQANAKEGTSGLLYVGEKYLQH